MSASERAERLVLDGHSTHVAVRMIHVLAATVLVGGSLGMAVDRAIKSWSRDGRGDLALPALAS